MNNWILVLNAGSSSLKFALVDAVSGDSNFDGLAERLGSPQAVIKIKNDGVKTESAISDGSMASAIAKVIEALPEGAKPVAIGHRVVQGGEKFRVPTLIDAAALEEIAACSHLAPLHSAANLAGIEAAQAAFPELPQVAVFDTSFHAQLPEKVFQYAIPQELYREHSIRRYGMHGTSYEFVSQEAARVLGKDVKEAQLLVAHLGNGCSASAIRDGHSVDTTMGMTPLEGLVMGTRSGDVDPGIILWMAQQQGMSGDEISDVLNKKSGLLGLSELTNDCRGIEEAAAEGHKGALLALDVFIFRLARTLAALSASLDHIDGLVFTGGIGENSDLVRRRVVEQLRILGLKVNDQANADRGRSHPNIAAEGSPAILVINTNEEFMIAKHTLKLTQA
ncbi:acetate kinase [Sinobacterium caligoides]|uniref:Acetate kinase n=1 Tax=Sinobacterium caligoides TaxID=933926 RepID=A0A3N2DFZ3_9GAMM|nr:acetate kinase [Sinobacterium caligoides]ROR98712.1 acetate kinase [Sinobacterium caligoides]